MRKNEPTAARRLVPVDLVDNNGQPYAGSVSTPTLKIAKAGGNWVAANAVALVTLTGGPVGTYSLQLSAAEVDTSGTFRYSVDVGTARHFDDYVVVDEEADSIIASLVTIAAGVANALTRLPASLDSGANMRSGVATIANGAITTLSTADGFLTSVKFADGFLTNAKIADGFLSSAKLVDALFTSAKFADAFLTNAKIADGFLSAAKLANNTLTAAAIATDAGVKIATAVGALVIDGSRTLKGILARTNSLILGKATGLLASTVTFFLEDGTTKAFEYTQNTSAGTRVHASTVNAD